MLDARKLAQKYQVDVANKQQARLEDLNARRKAADAKLAQLRKDKKQIHKKEEKKDDPIESKQPRREGGNINIRSSNTVKGRAKKETGDINPNKDVSSTMKHLTINSEKTTAVLGIFERHWSIMMAYAFLRLFGLFVRSLILEGAI
jgi:chromosome segregation ATPase